MIRILISFFLLIVVVSHAISQMVKTNPFVSKENFYLDEHNLEGVFSFRFSTKGASFTIREKQPLYLTVCLMNISPIDGLNSLMDQSNGFDWKYDANTNCFVAKLAKNIDSDDSYVVNVKVKGQEVQRCKGIPKMGYNVNIQPSPVMNGFNNTEDDNIHDFICVEKLTTNTDNHELEKTMIYPNPTFNKIKISYSSQIGYEKLELWDNIGKLVLTRELPPNSTDYDLEMIDLDSGIYRLKLSDQKGVVEYNTKIIKIK